MKPTDNTENHEPDLENSATPELTDTTGQLSPEKSGQEAPINENSAEEISSYSDETLPDEPLSDTTEPAVQSESESAPEIPAFPQMFSPAEAITASPVEGETSEPPVPTSMESATGPAMVSQPAPFVSPESMNAEMPVSPVTASAPFVVSPQPVVTAMPVMSSSMNSGGPGGKHSRRNIFVIAVVALIVILGGGYTFALYLPNTPGAVFKSGLSNTAAAYNQLTNYATTTASKHYKGTKGSGTLTLNAGGIAGDGSFDFQNSGATGTGDLKLDVAGQKLTADIRAVEPSGQTTPDLYFQVSGIKSLLDSYGLTSYDSLDSKWISVDHTLLQSAAGSVTKGGDASAAVPTIDEIQDAAAKIGVVDKQYLFTTDSSKAVLKEQKYLGKSTQNGRSVYGYQVGYDKSHLTAYVNALSTALDSSKLDAWAKASNGKSLSATAGIGSLKDSIAKAKSDYSFTMYVDAKTKLIGKLHFTDTSSSDYFEVGQAYTGGAVYPFSFKVASGTGSDTQIVTLNVSINSTTNDVTVGASFNGTSGGSPTKLQLNATVSPSNDAVNVTAPSGATSINDIIDELGFGGDSSDTSALDDAGLSAGTNDMFTLTQ